MRVSDISNWATCEAMAMASPRQESRVGVAAWVGTLAHATLLGQSFPEMPGRIRFDHTTPTIQVAGKQAHIIAEKASELLIDHGWTIMEAEREIRGEDLVGHLDILAWHSERKEQAIIDLKTGQNIGAGWLQVGGYLVLDGRSIDYGGILHVPRVPINKECKGALEIRDGQPLAAAWVNMLRRVAEVQGGTPPTRSPGHHCHRCQANCPVRV